MEEVRTNKTINNSNHMDNQKNNFQFSAIFLLILIVIGIYFISKNSSNISVQTNTTAPSQTVTLADNSNLNKSSKNNTLPTPYNQFKYMYTTSHFSDGGDFKLKSFISYINNDVSVDTNESFTKIAINSDGSGFYQYQEQGEKTIDCGDQQLNAWSDLDFTRQECVSVNGNKYVVANKPYFVNKKYIVYEQCQNSSYYSNSGKNECNEYLLKINDITIDVTDNYNADLGNLPANEFSDVKVINNIVTFIKPSPSTNSNSFLYTNDQFKSYNLSTNDLTLEYTAPINSYITKAQLINGKPAIDLDDFSAVNTNSLIGMNSTQKMDYIYNGKNDTSSLILPTGNIINNIKSFASKDNHLYLIQQDNFFSNQFLILIDNLGVLKIPASTGNSNVGIYPNCDINSLVCLYNNSDYLIKAKADQNDIPKDSFLIEPESYYPNNIKILEPLDGYMDLPFVFSSGGETYIVYYDGNIIYGEDVSKDIKPTKLFEINSSDHITQLRVFSN